MIACFSFGSWVFFFPFFFVKIAVVVVVVVVSDHLVFTFLFVS